MSQFQTQFANPVAPQAAQSAQAAGQFAQQNQDRALQAAGMRQRGALAQQQMGQERDLAQQQMGQQERLAGMARDTQLQQTRMEQEGWDKQRAAQAAEGEANRANALQLQREEIEARKEASDLLHKRSVALTRAQMQMAMAPAEVRASMQADYDRMRREKEDHEHRFMQAEHQHRQFGQQLAAKMGEHRRHVDSQFDLAKKLESDGQVSGTKAWLDAMTDISVGDDVDSPLMLNGPEFAGIAIDKLGEKGLHDWGFDPSYLTMAGESLGWGTKTSTDAIRYLNKTADEFRGQAYQKASGALQKVLLQSGYKGAMDSEVTEALNGIFGAWASAKAAHATGSPQVDPPDLQKHLDMLEKKGIPPTVMREALSAMAQAAEGPQGAAAIKMQISEIKGKNGGYMPWDVEHMQLARRAQVMDAFDGLGMFIEAAMGKNKTLSSASVGKYRDSISQADSPEAMDAITLPAGAGFDKEFTVLRGMRETDRQQLQFLRDRPQQDFLLQSKLDQEGESLDARTALEVARRQRDAFDSLADIN